MLTQVASSIRRGTGTQKQGISFASYVFTTHVGCRPAEACTLSVVATHQLLTQLLLYIMYFIRHYDAQDEYATTAGSSYVREEVHELAELNEGNLEAIREIIGDVHGGGEEPGGGGGGEQDLSGLEEDGAGGGTKQLSVTDTPTSKALRQQGLRWAQHILEGPITWIFSAAYILVTVPRSAAHHTQRPQIPVHPAQHTHRS